MSDTITTSVTTDIESATQFGPVEAQYLRRGDLIQWKTGLYHVTKTTRNGRNVDVTARRVDIIDSPRSAAVVIPFRAIAEVMCEITD